MRKTFTLAFLAFCCLSLHAQNRGLYFDGSNDYVEAPIHVNNTTFGSAITIEAWINTTNANLANQTILNRGTNDSYSLYLTSNKLSCIIGMAGFVQAPYTFNNSWHHVAAVYNGSNLQLYVDGNPVGTPAPLTGNVVVDNGYKLILGMYPPTVASKFSGTMDEVRVWNVARTQAQIQASMNRELQTASNPNLRVYYRFNQGTAGGSNAGQTTLTDAVGGSNGSLFGFALTGATSNWVGGKPSMTMLPLQIGNFSANRKNRNLWLYWSTYTEQQTAFFDVERSSDNQQFIAIGRVQAAGYSTEQKHYSFSDNMPQPAAKYYRLRAVDAGGAVTYSKTFVTNPEEGALALFPNPASTTLQVQCPATAQKLTIQNIHGVIVKEISIKGEGWQSLSINVDALPGGTYFVRAGEASQTFVKQ